MTAKDKWGRGRGRNGLLRYLMTLAVLALFPLDTSARSSLDQSFSTAPSLPAAVSIQLEELLQLTPGHLPTGTSFLCLPPQSGENS